MNGKPLTASRDVSNGMPRNEPQITVLIDTYNYGRYIEEAIDSVLAQNFPEEQREILIVDDGSTDDTAERVKKYGDRVRYVRKANGGQGSAFNTGFAEARGRIIAFLDADDYWLPGKLRRVVEEFQKNPDLGMVHHGLTELDMRTGRLSAGLFTPMNGNVASSAKRILSFNPTPTSTLAFSRPVLEKIFPMPEAIRIQADGYIQAVAPFLAPIAAIDEPLAVYRNHGSNLYFLSDNEGDRERRRQRAVTMKAIVEGMREWFASHGYSSKDAVVRPTIRRWITMQESEEFAVNPPGRIRFCRHLLESYGYRFPVMTWRLALINYVDACGALFVGYEKFPHWSRRREEFIHWVNGLLGKDRHVGV
jgi:glycosyltransferase involved in cell wall biosynthesis